MCFTLLTAAVSSRSKTLKIIKLGRILRLLRLSRLWHFLQRFKFTALLRMMRLFGLYCFVSHWIACLWFAIPWIEESVLGGTWSSDFRGSNSWIKAQGLVDAPLFAKYTASLYWAFTTIATGNCLHCFAARMALCLNSRLNINFTTDCNVCLQLDMVTYTL